MYHCNDWFANGAGDHTCVSFTLHLPIAVPFATLRPGLLVFFISALFSLKFLTALWALSKFIDERMIGYMYNNTSNLVQLDSNDTGSDRSLPLCHMLVCRSCGCG